MAALDKAINSIRQSATAPAAKTGGAVAAPRESEVLNNPLYQPAAQAGSNPLYAPVAPAMNNPLYTPARPVMENPLHQDGYEALSSRPTGAFLGNSGGGDGNVLGQGGGGGLTGGIDGVLDMKGGGGLAGGIDAYSGRTSGG